MMTSEFSDSKDSFGDGGIEGSEGCSGGLVYCIDGLFRFRIKLLAWIDFCLPKWLF